MNTLIDLTQLINVRTARPSCEKRQRLSWAYLPATRFQIKADIKSPPIPCTELKCSQCYDINVHVVNFYSHITKPEIS